jgi:hypothetical protein
MSAVRIALASVVLAAVVPLAAAAERDREPEGTQCVSIDDAAARLACYDQAFGRPTAAGVASAAVAEDAAPALSDSPPAGASPDAVRAADEFGLTETAKRKRDPEKAKEAMPESISATVARVSWRPTGEVVVTLENDQVWEQAEIVTTTARVKPGDVVTIRKAALGSHTMVTAGRAVIRVRRVR